MASVNISIPTGYPQKQALEIVAKYNKVEVTFTEAADIALPTIVAADKSEICGLVPIAFSLARTSKGAPKGWAKEVLGDGVPQKAAEVEQFSQIAFTVFNNACTDIKPIIGQVSTHLKTRTFLASLENSTIADVLLAVALYPHVQALTNDERVKSFSDLTRWIIFINELLGSPLPGITVPANPYQTTKNPSRAQKGQQGQEGKKGQQDGKKGGPPAEGQMRQGGRKAKAKAAQPAKPAAQPEQDNRDPFSWIDVRVGKIVKVWPHPNADTLYCEEIDIGNGVIKKVVTGVRNYVPIEEMQDRHVVVFTNIKPSKIRQMPSESMVFAGSNADHTVVELLEPPADAPIGTRVTCGDFVQGEVPGIDKKGKFWEAVNQNNNLTINENHLACYKGVPLSTPYGNIKVKTLTNCEFH